MLDSYHQSD